MENRLFNIQDGGSCPYCGAEFDIVYTAVRIETLVYCPFCGVKTKTEEENRVVERVVNLLEDHRDRGLYESMS